MERARVLNIPLDLITMAAALERASALLAQPGTDQIVTLNPEMVLRAQSDPGLLQIIIEASLVTPDGSGIVWALNRQGIKAERVTGIDLSLSLLQKGGQSLRVFFLGGTPGVAEAAATAAQRQFGIQIAGHQHGFFAEEGLVVEQIANAEADLLLVGLGPAQEGFIYRNRAELGARLAIGVGGTLDVLAGKVRRAPSAIQRARLEWAWRVIQDPGRIPRLLPLARFARLVVRENSRSL